MVTIRVQLDENECIRYAEAEGHAGGAVKGSNVACAGVTVLIRTAARLLENEDNILLEGEAPHPGTLFFRVERYPVGKIERIIGITRFLCLGLKDIENDFPGEIDVRIEKGKEFTDGT